MGVFMWEICDVCVVGRNIQTEKESKAIKEVTVTTVPFHCESRKPGGFQYEPIHWPNQQLLEITAGIQ